MEDKIVEPNLKALTSKMQEFNKKLTPQQKEQLNQGISDGDRLIILK